MKQAERRLLVALLVAALLVFTSVYHSALAIDTYWDHNPSSSASWHNAGNWSAGVPDSSKRVYVDNGGTAIIDGDAESGLLGIGIMATGRVEQIGGTHEVSVELFLDGVDGTYDLNSGNLISPYEFIAMSNTGVFNQIGGSHAITGGLNFGHGIGSKGTYNLVLGDLTAGYEVLGYNDGAGEINQTGGVNDAGALILGVNLGSKGTYNLHDGQLITQYQNIGDFSGVGEFSQFGGTNSIATNLCLGRLTGSSGSYTLSGGRLSAGNEYIGSQGNSGAPGTFAQFAGLNAVDGTLTIGGASEGTYNFWGGALSAEFLDVNNGYLNIDVSGIDYFRVFGDKVAPLNEYIASGRIYDNTSSPDNHLLAVYDPTNDWTTLQVVPEPGTIALIAPAVLGFAGVVWRRRLRTLRMTVIQEEREI